MHVHVCAHFRSRTITLICITLISIAKSEDEEDFRGMPSHDDGTSSGYFLDADTSSCGSFEVDCESCDSEGEGCQRPSAK